MTEVLASSRPTRRVLMLVALVMTIALVAFGCGDSDDSSDLRSESELEAGLLTLDDLPDGWVDVTDELADDRAGGLCGIEVTEILDLDVDELPNAEIAFAGDPEVGPLLLFAVGFVPEGRGGEAFDGTAQRLEDCDDEEDGGYRYSVTPIPFPTTGDESVAVNILQEDLDTGEVLEFEVVYSRSGDMLVVSGAVDPNGGNATALLEECAPKAVTRANDELNS